MPKFVATLRAEFDADADGVAEAIAQNVLMAVEDVLGEDDEEGDPPSYRLQMTEVLPFDSATTYIELADHCIQLRNQLIATKRKPAIDQAVGLDELAWMLRRTIDPEDVNKEILPQYDRARFWDVCSQVWAGKNPTD